MFRENVRIMPEFIEEYDGADEDFVQKLTSCQPALQVYVTGMVPRRADVDDIIQEVNLALWRKRSRYNPEHDFLRWALGFAMVEVRNFKGKSARARIWFSDAVLELLAIDWPRDASFAEDRREALAACMTKLARRERDVLEAYYGRGVRVDKIASEMSASLSRIYKILTRARNLLRGCVQRSLAQHSHWERQT